MRIFFAWYDFWVGWYWDRSRRILYVCPLPMVVMQFGRGRTPSRDDLIEQRAALAQEIKRLVNEIRKGDVVPWPVDQQEKQT